MSRIGVAYRPWLPRSAGELTLEVGQHVAVITDAAGGWFDGVDASGRRGYFPMDCVGVVESGRRVERVPAPHAGARSALIDDAVAEELAVASPYAASLSSQPRRSASGLSPKTRRYQVEWEGTVDVPESGFTANEMIDVTSPSGDRVIIVVPERAGPGTQLRLSLDPASDAPRCTVVRRGQRAAAQTRLDVAWTHNATVRVPVDGFASSTIEVTSPSGDAVSIAVPRFATPGQKLRFEMDSSAGAWGAPESVRVKPVSAQQAAAGAEERPVLTDLPNDPHMAPSVVRPEELPELASLAAQLGTFGGLTDGGARDMGMIEYTLHNLATSSDPIHGVDVLQFVETLSNMYTGVDQQSIRSFWTSFFSACVAFKPVVTFDALWWTCVAVVLSEPTTPLQVRTATEWIAMHYSTDKHNRMVGARAILELHRALRTPHSTVLLGDDASDDAVVSRAADLASSEDTFNTWINSMGGEPDARALPEHVRADESASAPTLGPQQMGGEPDARALPEHVRADESASAPTLGPQQDIAMATTPPMVEPPAVLGAALASAPAPGPEQTLPMAPTPPTVGPTAIPSTGPAPMPNDEGPIVDKDALVIAMGLDWKAYLRASDELKADEEIVVVALEDSNGEAMAFVPDSLKHDLNFLKEEILHVPLAVKHLDADWLAAHDPEHEVIIKAVSQDGLLLQFAGAAAQSDKEVVLDALSHAGIALQYASVDLRAKRDVVMEAVAMDGLALQYASADLQADAEVVATAVEQNSAAKQFSTIPK